MTIDACNIPSSSILAAGPKSSPVVGSPRHRQSFSPGGPSRSWCPPLPGIRTERPRFDRSLRGLRVPSMGRSSIRSRNLLLGASCSPRVRRRVPAPGQVRERPRRRLRRRCRVRPPRSSVLHRSRLDAGGRDSRIPSSARAIDASLVSRGPVFAGIRIGRADRWWVSQ